MMDNSGEWYRIKQPEKIDSPALILYPERIKENINTLKRMVNGTEKIRPHVKTSKSKEAVMLMMEAGIKKFKCATIAEAEMLAICGAPDVLLAYQLNSTKLLRFVSLIQYYPKTSFSCLVDNIQSAKLISSTAATSGIVISVFIDLNIGMNRTGISPGNKAIDLYETIVKLPGIKLAGLHAYDGHIHEMDLIKRTELCNKDFTAVEEMRKVLKTKGYPMPLVVAGGSPTFSIHAQRENSECSPGTFIFWDKGYHDALPEQHFLFAALVISRVISIPAEGAICIDLGHKSIASENELQHRVFFLNAPHLKPISHSEEHMVVDAGKDHSFKVGDLLYVLPIHICPTVALYSHAVCIESGKIAGNWQIIARDRQIIH